MHLRRILAVVVVVASWLAADRARAQVAADQQSALILRILSFEKNLKKRSGEKQLGIAVVFRSGNKTSEGARDALIQALEAQAKKTKVNGLGVKVVAIPWSDAGSFEAKAKTAAASAVYVCPGLETSISAISGVTRKKSILSFTAVETAVKSGLAIGLVMRGDKPTILVNLPAAKAEGADLDAALLKVSEVLK